MVTELFPSQTAQSLSLGARIVPGRRYGIGVVGTTVPFSLQYSMPNMAGLKNIQGFVGITPADADAILQLELPVITPGLYITFESDPGTYTVLVQEIKEGH